MVVSALSSASSPNHIRREECTQIARNIDIHAAMRLSPRELNLSRLGAIRWGRF